MMENMKEAASNTPRHQEHPRVKVPEQRRPSQAEIVVKNLFA